MSDTVVLYHADADGFASAFAIWLCDKPEDSATYLPVQYSQPVPELPEGTKTVYIVDFSYKRDICEDLAKRVDKILILDHHKTAEKELEGLPYAIFDQTKSGAGITWEQFHQGAMPLMLQYVQDRDLWKFDLPYSEIINLYLGSLPHDFQVWSRVCFGKDFLNTAKAAGEAIKQFRDGQMKGAVRDTRTMRLSLDGATFEVPVVNCSANVSEVGNELCKIYPEAPFSASYCDRKDIRSWSLRSVGDFDVSLIAKAFGGGGHKNAAGFSTDIGWPQYDSDEFLKEFEK